MLASVSTSLTHTCLSRPRCVSLVCCLYALPHVSSHRCGCLAAPRSTAATAAWRPLWLPGIRWGCASSSTPTHRPAGHVPDLHRSLAAPTLPLVVDVPVFRRASQNPKTQLSTWSLASGAEATAHLQGEQSISHSPQSSAEQLKVCCPETTRQCSCLLAGCQPGTPLTCESKVSPAGGRPQGRLSGCCHW